MSQEYEKAAKARAKLLGMTSCKILLTPCTYHSSVEYRKGITLNVISMQNLTSDIFEGLSVATAAVMEISIFWDITQCSPLKLNRRFGTQRRLNLQGT
jgi:hypothetical protein